MWITAHLQCHLTHPEPTLPPTTSSLLRGGKTSIMREVARLNTHTHAQALHTLSLQRNCQESSGWDPQNGQGEVKLKWSQLAGARARLRCPGQLIQGINPASESIKRIILFSHASRILVLAGYPFFAHCCNEGVWRSIPTFKSSETQIKPFLRSALVSSLWCADAQNSFPFLFLLFLIYVSLFFKNSSIKCKKKGQINLKKTIFFAKLIGDTFKFIIRIQVALGDV